VFLKHTRPPPPPPKKKKKRKEKKKNMNCIISHGICLGIKRIQLALDFILGFSKV
jgi:hypothetical protein